MSDEINAQFGFERVFGKTNGNADTDTKITKFGISFNSDGITTFYAELEKSSASQKEYLEKIQEKNCLLYTSPSPRDGLLSRMPSSA